jgi:hypothetical protein
MIENTDFISIAYAKGVAMGSDLPSKPQDVSAPGFAIMAAKDANSGNLDRVQIIKVWLDSDGKSQEKIFEVAHSGQRFINAETNKLEPVGNTVDLADASYQNTIGSKQLTSLWQDPQFNAQQQAVYYARVLEIPTPRWSTYDAAKLGVKAPEPSTIQEMAWSSPIWYAP